jgi:hypothetical protein
MIKMKKNYFAIAAMAVCLSLPVLFTSCGSSSDDDGQEVINPENSVMKMELSLSGDYAKYNPYLAFHAWDLKGKGMTMQTSTGQDVDMIWEQIYDNTPFTYGSVQIKGSYSSFSATLILSNSLGEAGTVSVHAKVYKDDAVIRDQTLDVDVKATEGTVSISYIPEEGFTRVE